jgi:TetR/AcrR family transcriptional regulator, transcriptional repressor for nem operon
VASVTVRATAQGLTPGFTAVVCAVPVVCVAANHTPSSGWEVDSRRDRSVANGSIIFPVAAKQTLRSARIAVRSPRKGDQTRQHIIAQSAALFNQKGYEGCSLQEIMAAAGVEKGGIYRHFRSKEELALAAFDFAWAEVSYGRTRGLEEIEDPLLRIAAFIRNFADRKPALRGGCPLLNTAIDADDGNAALRALAREALEGWRTRLHSLISLAVRQGKLRTGVRPYAVASLIIGTLEGALMMSRLDEDRTALKIARDHLISHMESLRIPKPRTDARGRTGRKRDTMKRRKAVTPE